MVLATYRYNLGKDLYLDAYALSPEINASTLKEMVVSKDRTSKFNLKKLEKDMTLTGWLDSFKDLRVKVSTQPYQIPEELKPYRQALEAKLVAGGKFNGSVAIVNGPLQNPLNLCLGGYFDFMATKLEIIPGDLLPDKYPQGKTIKELMPEWGMTNNQRARFLGFAFIMHPNNGKEISLVQRAKGLGIAADCISSSGGTPKFDKRFFESNFNFADYYEQHVAEEMDEEYGLNKKDFLINGIFLIDDISTVPHGALKIITPVTMPELAEKSSRSKDALKEHPILYNMPIESVRTFLNRFDMWPSVSFVLHHLDKENIK